MVRGFFKQSDEGKPYWIENEVVTLWGNLAEKQRENISLKGTESQGKDCHHNFSFREQNQWERKDFTVVAASSNSSGGEEAWKKGQVLLQVI